MESLRQQLTRKDYQVMTPGHAHDAEEDDAADDGDYGADDDDGN